MQLRMVSKCYLKGNLIFTHSGRDNKKPGKLWKTLLTYLNIEKSFLFYKISISINKKIKIPV